MHWSFVVAFKNREQERVRFFLESLQFQSETDFELVFVNQGSDVEVNSWLEPLLTRFPFVTYVQNFTVGQFFNKSHALNIGIKLAKGEFIVICDIDLLFPKGFLKMIRSHLKPGKFLTFNAFYLPENLAIIDITMFFQNQVAHGCFERFIGLCVASREMFLDIHGYDEYYMAWGAEDDDIIIRLEKAGATRFHLKAEETEVYHQWHKPNSPVYATPWYIDMVNYLYFTVDKHKSRSLSFGERILQHDRPILERLSNPGLFHTLEFVPSPFFQIIMFMDGFHKMKSGDFGKYEYKPSPVLKIPRGRKQFLVDKLNTVLEKFGSSFKMTKGPSEAPLYTRDHSYDMITYFVGKNRPFLRDYYLLDTDEELSLYFQKR